MRPRLDFGNFFFAALTLAGVAFFLVPFWAPVLSPSASLGAGSVEGSKRADLQPDGVQALQAPATGVLSAVEARPALIQALFDFAQSAWTRGDVRGRR